MVSIEQRINKLTEPTAADDLGAFVPTPEEIAEVCRIIQSEWSEAERERRRAFPGTIAVDTNRTFRFGVEN